MMDNSQPRNIESKRMEQLTALRKLVKLSLLDQLRVLKARKRAEKVGSIFNEDSNDVYYVPIDYSVAEELEYYLRYQELSKMVLKDYQSYINCEKDGYSLGEWVDSVINDYVEKEKRNNQR